MGYVIAAAIGLSVFISENDLLANSRIKVSVCLWGSKEHLISASLETYLDTDESDKRKYNHSSFILCFNKFRSNRTLIKSVMAIIKSV